MEPTFLLCHPVRTVLFAALLLASCSSPHPRQEEGFSMRASLAAVLAMPERPVVKKFLDCAREDFPLTFHANLNGNAVTIGNSAPMVLVSVLKNKLDSLSTKEENEFIGMRIHHGLKVESGLVSYAPSISFGVLSDPDGDDWQWKGIGGEVYTIGSNNGLELATDTLGPWLTYRDTVKVLRNSNDLAFEAINDSTDVRTYTFHGGYIDSLMAHNNTDAVYLKLVCMAEPTTEVDRVLQNMRHHIALVTATGAGVELLDDVVVPKAETFSMRALNVGNPCPPNCAVMKFPAAGLAIRSTCL